MILFGIEIIYVLSLNSGYQKLQEVTKFLQREAI